MSGSFLRPSLCASSNAHPSIHPSAPCQSSDHFRPSSPLSPYPANVRTDASPSPRRPSYPSPFSSLLLGLCDILGRLSRARIAAIVTDEEDRGGWSQERERGRKKESNNNNNQQINRQINKQTDRQINERRGALLFVGGARARPTRVARGSPLASSAFPHACMNGRVIDARYARDGNFSKDRGGNSRRHVVASTGGVDEDEDEEGGGGGGGGGEVGGWKACEVTRWQRWIATRTQPAVQSAEVEDEEVQVLELMESEVLPQALLVV